MSRRARCACPLARSRVRTAGAVLASGWPRRAEQDSGRGRREETAGLEAGGREEGLLTKEERERMCERMREEGEYV